MKRRLVPALLTLALIVSWAAPASAAAKVRKFCAYREGRMYVPFRISTYLDMPRVWELDVCAAVEYDGETIKPLTERPTITWDVAPPYAPVWKADNCRGWTAKRSDGWLWIHGECEVSWRVWFGPLPVTVATWTVAQEFALAPDGYQDIYYPAPWRGVVGEQPRQLDPDPPEAGVGSRKQ